LGGFAQYIPQLRERAIPLAKCTGSTDPTLHIRSCHRSSRRAEEDPPFRGQAQEEEHRRRRCSFVLSFIHPFVHLVISSTCFIPATDLVPVSHSFPTFFVPSSFSFAFLHSPRPLALLSCSMANRPPSSSRKRSRGVPAADKGVRRGLPKAKGRQARVVVVSLRVAFSRWSFFSVDFRRRSDV
jgi:hypothetical protein